MPPIPLGVASTTSSSAGVADTVVSVAVLCYVLYRQRQVRVLQTALLLPVVLGVVGLVSVLSDAKSHPLSAGQVAVLVALLLADAVALGAVRAFTVRTWRDGEQVLRQGSWLTVGLWLVGVAVHEGALAAVRIDSSSLLLYVGLTLGAQRLVLDARARSRGAGTVCPKGQRTPPTVRGRPGWPFHSLDEGGAQVEQLRPDFGPHAKAVAVRAAMDAVQAGSPGSRPRVGDVTSVGPRPPG